MRHAGEEVVRDVRVCYVVEHVVQQPIGPVHGAERPAQPLPLVIGVVGQRRVGVLCGHMQG